MTTTRRLVLAGGAALFGNAGAAFAATGDLVVSGGIARFGRSTYKCAVGRGGVRADKREGDGATPAGSWPIRDVMFRPDRIKLPRLRLDARALRRDDGWCDAPADANYNQPVSLPYPASAETLWREDGIYDIIVVLGYNDRPAIPGKGSAIFLHVARQDYSPTLGCVALARDNLIEFLSRATRSTRVVVRRTPST